MKETPEQMAERIGQAVIEQIETESLEADMSLNDAAEVCRQVAMDVRRRGGLFEEEAGN